MNKTFQWVGRCDGMQLSHMRMHQIIDQHIDQANTQVKNDQTYTLIGFCSDEGVQRNQGRVGAALAPDLIRKQLANLPVHQPIHVEDAGNIECIDHALEQAQQQLSTTVTTFLSQGKYPIVLGGGHEVAYGSFKGLFDFAESNLDENGCSQQIGIINFDAHFDLRDHPEATSGTPFLQAAKLSQSQGKNFAYLCLGVAQHANTKILFDTADTLHCQYVYDYEMSAVLDHQIKDKIQKFIDQVDLIYITVDLDVFSAHIAPGVSAPAVRGIDVATFENIFNLICASGKVRLLDIAECNPKYDIDQHTAKLAAYIIYQYLFYRKI